MSAILLFSRSCTRFCQNIKHGLLRLIGPILLLFDRLSGLRFFFVAILQTKLRQKGSVPEVGNISGDPKLLSWSGRRKAVVSKFPTQTARTGLRQILRNFKLRRSASWSACLHYISASTNLYLDNRKQNIIHLSLSVCLSVCLSLSLSLSLCLARWHASFLSLYLCFSVCLSVCLSLIPSHASFLSCQCMLFDLLV